MNCELLRVWISHILPRVQKHLRRVVFLVGKCLTCWGWKKGWFKRSILWWKGWWIHGFICMIWKNGLNVPMWNLNRFVWEYVWRRVPGCHSWDFTEHVWFWTREIKLFEHVYVCWTDVFVPFCAWVWSVILSNICQVIVLKIFDCLLVLRIIKTIGGWWRFIKMRDKYLFAQDILLSNFNPDLHPGQGASRDLRLGRKPSPIDFDLWKIYGKNCETRTKNVLQFEFNWRKEGAKTCLHLRRCCNCLFEHGHHCWAKRICEMDAQNAIRRSHEMAWCSILWCKWMWRSQRLFKFMLCSKTK